MTVAAVAVAATLGGKFSALLPATLTLSGAAAARGFAAVPRPLPGHISAPSLLPLALRSPPLERRRLAGGRGGGAVADRELSDETRLLLGGTRLALAQQLDQLAREGRKVHQQRLAARRAEGGGECASSRVGGDGAERRRVAVGKAAGVAAAERAAEA